MSDLLRTYTRSDEIGRDGYPRAWHKCTVCLGEDPDCFSCEGHGSIKALVRAQAGHRCVRCSHPYRTGLGKWSPCDERCTHGGPARARVTSDRLWEARREVEPELLRRQIAQGIEVQAEWRILTVHHLTGDKPDCRWWNLAALCQRCHLTIQGRVQMMRVYPWEHSEWFRIYAAGWYAWVYEGRDITREEAAERIDELLAYELAA